MVDDDDEDDDDELSSLTDLLFVDVPSDPAPLFSLHSCGDCSVKKKSRPEIAHPERHKTDDEGLCCYVWIPILPITKNRRGRPHRKPRPASPAQALPRPLKSHTAAPFLMFCN